MHTLAKAIYRQAKLKNILILLAPIVALVGFILPKAEASLLKKSGEYGSLDYKFSYSFDFVDESLAAYGSEGRSLFVWVLATLDVIYPVLTALFLSLLIGYLAQKVYGEKLLSPYIVMIPFSTLILDFLENASLATLALRYPDLSAAVAQAASLFTSAKWLTAAASLLLIAYLAIKALFKRFASQ